MNFSSSQDGSGLLAYQDEILRRSNCNAFDLGRDWAGAIESLPATEALPGGKSKKTEKDIYDERRDKAVAEAMLILHKDAEYKDAGASFKENLEKGYTYWFLEGYASTHSVPVQSGVEDPADELMFEFIDFGPVDSNGEVYLPAPALPPACELKDKEDEG